jgi:hypothetical protein
MATYYVDVTTGDDSDTGLTEALAWQTLEKAADSVAAGDKVWVKASASYVVKDSGASCVMQVTIAGTSASAITFEGYSSNIGDGGIVTIDATTNTLASAVITAIGGAVYYWFKNFRFTGGSSHGFDANSEADDRIMFSNCRFDNNGAHGLLADDYFYCENCRFDNNTTDGAHYGSNCVFVACVANDNTSEGFRGEHNTLCHCMSYENGSSQIVGEFGSPHNLLNILVDGNNSARDGFTNTSFTGHAIANSIFFDCDDGINGNASRPDFHIARNNLFYSNTTDRNNFREGEGTVSGTSDPFVDSANNDYRLKRDSEARGAGIDAHYCQSFWDDFDSNNPPTGTGYSDIGPDQRRESTRRTRIYRIGH